MKEKKKTAKFRISILALAVMIFVANAVPIPASAEMTYVNPSSTTTGYRNSIMWYYNFGGAAGQAVYQFSNPLKSFSVGALTGNTDGWGGKITLSFSTNGVDYFSDNANLTESTPTHYAAGTGWTYTYSIDGTFDKADNIRYLRINVPEQTQIWQLPSFSEGVGIELYESSVFDISVAAGIQNKVSVNKTTADSDELVTVTVAPEQGFQLQAGSLTYTYTVADQTYTKSIYQSTNGTDFVFVMPEAEVTVNAEFVELATVMGNTATIGAQIRNANGDVKQGLRFITRAYIDNIDISTMTTVMNGQTYQIRDFGTLLMPTDMLGENELTIETASVAKVSCTCLYEYVGGNYVDYAAVLTDIPIASYDREFTARAYITIKDGSGTQTIYYNPIVRSVNGVGGFNS